MSEPAGAEPGRTGPLPVDDPAFISNPFTEFARRRATGPVHWDDGLGMYLAYSHAAANAVLRHRSLGRIWSDREPEEEFEAFNLVHRHAILEMEPPGHTRLRRLVSAAFARSEVERLRARVNDLADGLADRVAEAGADGGVVDLMSIYAEPLPVEVIAELLAVPAADRPLLRPWSNAIVKMYEYHRSPGVEAAAEQAAREFAAYLRDLAAERRVDPGDDLISHLVTVREADGDRLSEDELVATGILLLNAGHEATVNTTGNGFRALMAHPDQMQWCRDRVDDAPAMATAAEELIRYDGPLQLFERTAVADVDIAGVTVREGEKIAALLGAANHDPEVFEHPESFRVDRDPNPHVGFGAGIHFCLGAPLARIELRASLATLLRRFPKLAPAGEARRRPEFVIRGLVDLPVTIT